MRTRLYGDCEGENRFGPGAARFSLWKFRSPLRAGGGSTGPSFGQELFIEAQASISVLSTEKYSIDKSLLTCGKASGAVRISRTASASSRRSRLRVNTVECGGASDSAGPNSVLR
jgi:hypothetical protein